MKNRIRYYCFIIIMILIFITNAVSAQDSLIEKEVKFKNDNITLSGTLLIPKGEGPFPAIVFLHGSGPHTREGFRSYAEKFVELGIASIFYDKRGTGSSTGSWIASSLENLADDAVQAIKLLNEDTRIDSDLIGIWGISQAGWIGPIVANKSESISFAVLISGGGASPKESEIFTYQNILDKANLSEDDKMEALSLVNQYFDYLETGKGYNELNDQIAKSKEKVWYQYIRLDRILPSEQNRVNWEWVATYNPEHDIKKIDFPLLLMFGGKDESHPTQLSISKWEKFLRPSIFKKAEFKVFPEAGHGIRMRHVEGSPFADGYMDTMLDWIQKNFEPTK